ncbi:hypothetical protein [Streptomyces sp. 1222.5]
MSHAVDQEGVRGGREHGGVPARGPAGRTGRRRPSCSTTAMT